MYVRIYCIRVNQRAICIQTFCPLVFHGFPLNNPTAGTSASFRRVRSKSYAQGGLRSSSRFRGKTTLLPRLVTAGSVMRGIQRVPWISLTRGALVHKYSSEINEIE